jgi:hypothetical protein
MVLRPPAAATCIGRFRSIRLPRPDERHHRPRRRGVVHAADPAHRVRRRQLCHARARLIQPSPRPAAAPRPAWRSLPRGLPVESRAAFVSDGTRPSVPVHGDPEPPIWAGTPGKSPKPDNRPLRGDLHRLLGPPRDGVRTGSHRHGNRPANARTGSDHGRMSPLKGVRAGELPVVTVGCLPGEAAAPVRAAQHVVTTPNHLHRPEPGRRRGHRAATGEARRRRDVRRQGHLPGRQALALRMAVWRYRRGELTRTLLGRCHTRSPLLDLPLLGSVPAAHAIALAACAWSDSVGPTGGGVGIDAGRGGEHRDPGGTRAGRDAILTVYRVGRPIADQPLP